MFEFTTINYASLTAFCQPGRQVRLEQRSRTPGQRSPAARIEYVLTAGDCRRRLGARHVGGRYAAGSGRNHSSTKPCNRGVVAWPTVKQLVDKEMASLCSA